MQPEDIGRIVSASDPKISPDGRMVAYVVTGSTSRPTGTAAPSGWRRPTDRRRRTSSPRASTATAARVVAGRAAPGLHQPASEDKDGKRKGTLHVRRCPSPARSSRWPSGTRLRGAGLVARRRPPRVHRPGAPVDEDDDRKRPPRKIDRLFTRLDRVGWTIDRPTHLRGAGRRLGPAAAVTGGPVRATQRRVVAGRHPARVRVGPPRGLGPRRGERPLHPRRRRPGDGRRRPARAPPADRAPTELVAPVLVAGRRPHRRADLRHADAALFATGRPSSTWRPATTPC